MEREVVTIGPLVVYESQSKKGAVIYTLSYMGRTRITKRKIELLQFLYEHTGRWLTYGELWDAAPTPKATSKRRSVLALLHQLLYSLEKVGFLYDEHLTVQNKGVFFRNSIATPREECGATPDQPAETEVKAAEAFGEIGVCAHETRFAVGDHARCLRPVPRFSTVREGPHPHDPCVLPARSVCKVVGVAALSVGPERKVERWARLESLANGFFVARMRDLAKVSS